MVYGLWFMVSVRKFMRKILQICKEKRQREKNSVFLELFLFYKKVIL